MHGSIYDMYTELLSYCGKKHLLHWKLKNRESAKQFPIVSFLSATSSKYIILAILFLIILCIHNIFLDLTDS